MDVQICNLVQKALIPLLHVLFFVHCSFILTLFAMDFSQYSESRGHLSVSERGTWPSLGRFSQDLKCILI